MTRDLLQRARDLMQDAMDTHIYNAQDGEEPDVDCAYAALVRDLDEALATPPRMHDLDGPELGAVLCGLRMLQEALDAGGQIPKRFEDILDNCQTCEPLDVIGIDSLCQNMNFNSRG